MYTTETAKQLLLFKYTDDGQVAYELTREMPTDGTNLPQTLIENEEPLVERARQVYANNRRGAPSTCLVGRSECLILYRQIPNLLRKRDISFLSIQRDFFTTSRIESTLKIRETFIRSLTNEIMTQTNTPP